MLTDAEKKLIIGSWRLVIPIAPTAAELFYKRLFELEPAYRRLFPARMEDQQKKLIRMLQFIVKSLDWADDQWQEEVSPEEDLCIVVLALGKRHDQLYRIPEASYDAAGQALLWTLGQGLGDAFTPDLHAAWAKLYGVLATTMKMGAKAGKLPLQEARLA